MTGRYCIIAGESTTTAQASDHLSGMNRVFCSGRFSVWSDSPAIALAEGGIVLGHLFTRTLPSRRVSHMDYTAYEALDRSHGRSLLKDYWGGYVAIFMEEDGRLSVFRDPSGAMPCFFGVQDGTVWLASEAGLIDRVRNGRRVNYLELARFLWSPDAMGTATCVTAVHELVAGQCLTTDGKRLDVRCWWSPWDFADRFVSSPADTAEILYATAADCIRAWADCFLSIVLGVSGGLDSSIIAACLLNNAPDVRCLTMIGPDAEGDESDYAQQLTNAFGLPLRMEDYDLAQIDVSKPVLPHLPWPIARHFAQNIQAVHKRLHDERSVDAYFTGSGGDNVFCSMRSATPLVDRFIAGGLSLGLYQSLVDICDLTGASMLTVLKAAWRKYRQRSRRYQIMPDPEGLSIGIQDHIAATSAPHPWLDAPQNALPGESAHIAMLMRAQKGLELYPRGHHPPQIAPLLSQPLVELCLAIPTWQWIEGGIDRSCARQAFRELLPDTLIHRTSKGGPGGFMRQIYAHNADTVIAMLREGLLMREGILDPRFLADPVRPGWQGIAKTQRLLSLSAAESWARWWENDHRM